MPEPKEVPINKAITGAEGWVLIDNTVIAHLQDVSVDFDRNLAESTGVGFRERLSIKPTYISVSVRARVHHYDHNAVLRLGIDPNCLPPVDIIILLKNCITGEEERYVVEDAVVRDGSLSVGGVNEYWEDEVTFEARSIRYEGSRRVITE